MNIRCAVGLSDEIVCAAERRFQMDMPMVNRPSAPPMVHGVIFVTPVSAWDGMPNDPPPPYSESPPPPFQSNTHVMHHGLMPLQPGYTTRGNCIHEPSQNARTGSRTIQLEPVEQRKPMTINKRYLSSNLALMKALEFASCFIGLAACVSFRLELGWSPISGERSGFFIILAAVCLVLVTAIFLTRLSGCMGGIQSDASFIKMAIIHVLCGGLVLISTALFTDIQVQNLCVLENAACIAFKISLGSGFITMLLFWIDAGLHVVAFKSRIPH
eukprot:gene19027-20940_t